MAVASPHAINKRHERFFYTGMAIAFVITVFAGFSRTFYLRPVFNPQPLIPLLILHGVVFTSWLALMITQTTLVATNRTRTHRKLGIAGGILAIAMVIIGTFTAIIRAKLLQLPPGSPPPLAFLTIPLGDLLMFATFVGAAFYYRRKLDIHKRLMLIATIAILPAAVARLPVSFIETGGPLVFFGLADLFLLPVLIYDIVTRGRPHRATVIAGALLVISHPLRMVVGGTQTWLAFATWLTHWVK